MERINYERQSSFRFCLISLLAPTVFHPDGHFGAFTATQLPKSNSKQFATHHNHRKCNSIWCSSCWISIQLPNPSNRVLMKVSKWKKLPRQGNNSKKEDFASGGRCNFLSICQMLCNCLLFAKQKKIVTILMRSFCFLIPFYLLLDFVLASHKSDVVRSTGNISSISPFPLSIEKWLFHCALNSMEDVADE